MADERMMKSKMSGLQTKLDGRAVVIAYFI